jgi:serine phosphatase RsbU (regulator of sigma subunit)
MPIGYYPNEKPSFTHHEIQLKSTDVFYLFSDGFADQLGGKKALKYKVSKLPKKQFLKIIKSQCLSKKKFWLRSLRIG